jgi:hypothetical protein
MIEILPQSLTFASCLLELGIEDSVLNLMNKNLLNQEEDVNAKWNGKVRKLAEWAGCLALKGESSFLSTFARN